MKTYATNMSRRLFIEGVGAFAATTLFGAPNDKKKLVSFGLVTDCHYADLPLAVRPMPVGDAAYRDSLAKMREFVSVMNRVRPAFAIELGDFKDQGPDKAATLGFLDKIEGVFAQFAGARYHVLGNHDMDSISKEDFLSHTANHGAAKGKSNYSFEMKGFKFIVLDGCFRADRKPYCCGNFNWTKAFFPDAELDWLDAELASATTPVFVFCHQLIDGFSKISRSLVIGNWQRAVELFERRGNVLCVFQGHHHDGLYGFRKGIHYWTMKGMITGPYPEHNSFALVDVSKSGDVFVRGFADSLSRYLPAHRAP